MSRGPALRRFVGPEFDLIAESGFRRFPPRLPEQPVFYPVLEREYAVQIARDWDTRDARGGHVGYVLESDVDAAYLSRFSEQIVGGS